MTKIALVTGASAGFGKAIVKKLVSDGYRVIASARRLEKLQSLQAELGEDKVYPLQMDVSQTDLIDQALASLPEDWKQIDLLVNNAGVAGMALFQDVTDEMWERYFNVNLNGARNTIQAVLPDMIKSLM